MIDNLKASFKSIFGTNHSNIYFAPGRVNLIGEHTDYNGGHVFPCAIDIGTYLVTRLRDDEKLRFYSENFKDLGIIETEIKNLVKESSHDWANYPKGVIKILTDAGYNIDRGLDLYFYGNIPNGAGLSSSASIELVTAYMINDLFNFNLDMITLVKFAQKSENQFIGVNCGIMDQFSIGLGKNSHAILLDTNTLKFTYVPITLEGYSIVISNTNKRRGLKDSKYNERRSECEHALEILSKTNQIKSLGELTNDDFNNLSSLLEDEVIRKRAKHAVYENQRTIKAKEALSKGNLEEFGQLMNESHISLRDDYEVTGIELDTLVSLAWKEKGVLGSRMTGAGFGGCTVSIVDNNYLKSFKSNIESAYEKIIGYKPSFYVVNIGDGTKKIS